MPRRARTSHDTHDTHDDASLPTRAAAGRIGGWLRGMATGLAGARRARAAAALRAAADAALPSYRMEDLESRRLLTTITGSGQMEYMDASGGSVRVAWRDLTAELIFISVADGATRGTLTGAFVPAGSDADDGFDLYHIYIAEANPNSGLSIARVDDPGDDPEPRPMLPFDGGISFQAFDIEAGDFADFTAGAGEIVIGGLTEGEDIFADRPILTAVFDGIGLLGPRPNGGNLAPGVQIEAGNDMGRLMIGGTVFGNVSIRGSIDTFYVGGLVTGNADGEGLGQVSVPRNFVVAGDMRNLIVGGSIGTHEAAGGELEEPAYQSGFDMQVGGTVGQIHARGAIHGSGLILNDPTTPRLRYRIEELEERIDTGLDRGQFTDFENFEFGDEDVNEELFVNDDANRAQYVGTINSRELGRNAIQINGTIQRTTLIEDYADYYAVGLLAGQTVTVRLIPQVPTFLNVGVFDPDGRLIATDYASTPQRALANGGQAFNFTAKRPGTYRFAVAGAGEADFIEGGEFDPAQLPGIIGYHLMILGAAGRNGWGTGIGGLVAVDGGDANTIFDARPGGGGAAAGWRIVRGDLGAVDADNSVISFSDRTFTLDEGNLRGIEAARIGVLDGNLFSAGIDLVIPNGSVGLLRATDAAGIMYINKNIAVETDAIPPDDQVFLGPQAVGFDYQTLDAAGSFYGNIVANRRIGVVRAGDMATLTASIFAANDDNVGNDGIIDLIDVGGDFGTLSAGGPQLSAGDGGNIRYIRVGGVSYRDLFFGGGEPETIVSTAGTPVDLVDDSGTPFRINPYPIRFQRIGGVSVPINPPQLNVLTLPVRRSRGGGGAGGLVTLDVTSTGGARIITNTTGRLGSVEIGRINSSGAGTPVIVDRRSIPGRIDTNPFDDILRLQTTATGELAGTDLSIILVGNATADVLEVVGGQFANIVNETPLGEVVSVNATSIGLLSATNIGLPKSHTGYGGNNLNGIRVGFTEVNPIDAFAAPADTFPWVDQRYGIFANTIADVRATQALGNIAVVPPAFLSGAFNPLLQAPGSIGRIIANFDGRAGDVGVHEGINAPIFANGQIRYVSIGEGVLPSGTGALSHGGIYANDTILRVVNTGLGSDIRGDIISENSIRSIQMNRGSIINSDIMVIFDGDTTHTGNDLRGSLELPDDPLLINNFPDSLDNPTFQIVQVALGGSGSGIIGANIIADDIGTILVDGGFGMFQTLLRTLGDGVIDNVSLDGYGMRSTSIRGGAQVNNINLFGRGSYPTTAWSPSVRLSEHVKFDPYFLTLPNIVTDLHRNLGTTVATPRLARVSSGGTLDDSAVVVSRTIGTIRGQSLRRSVFSAGNDIRDIVADDYVDTLQMTTGNLDNVAVGTDVVRSDWAASGRINNVRIRGAVRGNSQIRATGPNGMINTLVVGQSLHGHIFANVDINYLEARYLGSASRTVGGARFEGIYAGRDIRRLIVHGDVLSTATVRARDDMFQLRIGGDVQEGANITIDDQLIFQQINGQVFGDILVGNP